MRYVLALDQGTTSSRAIIFDETGKPVASASQEFKQHYPQPGWVEHDPDDLWRSQRDVAREVLRSSGLKAENLVACGISNQRVTEPEAVVAGPHPAIETSDPGPAGFTGSLIVAEFATRDAAIAWAAEDPYALAGVYARVIVKPFRKVLPA